MQDKNSAPRHLAPQHLATGHSTDTGRRSSAAEKPADRLSGQNQFIFDTASEDRTPDKTAHAHTAKRTVQEEQRPRRRRGNWKKGLLIWTLVLLVLGAACCAVFYRYAAVYEASRAELVMDGLLQKMSEQDFLAQARENLSIEVTEFEDALALFDDYYANAALTGNCTYRSDVRSTDKDQAVFIVRDGSTSICRVTLIPEGKNLGFGRHHWQLGSISSADFLASLESTEVTIEAPAAVEILLNGRKVSESWLTASGISCPREDSIECKFTEDGNFVRYTVSPLYGAIEVTDGDGEPLTLCAGDNGGSTDGKVRFIEERSAVYSLAVSAPENVTVTVNGYTLTPEDAASVSYGVFEDITLDIGPDVYETVTWSFDGLYVEPVITAFDAQGNSLTPVVMSDGKQCFFHANDSVLESEVRETAEDFFSAYTAYCSTKYDATLYQKIINRVARHSPLYEYFSNSYDVMLWATSTTTDYKELTFGNFSYLGDDAFICTVQYSADLTSKSWVDEYSYDVENAYEIVFVRSDDGKWLASDMRSLES